MNPYIKDFRTQVRSRFAEDSESMSYSDWIIANTRLRKKQFSFDGYEFQRQIVDDMHPNLSCIKCSQIGLTEVQLRKFAAFLARTTAVSAIFSLPTDEMYKRVSQTRFAPIVNEERVFNLGGDKPVRSMSTYQINQSFGYMVGNKEGDATSINADMLLHDELDLSDQEMIGLFQSRLQGSNYKITQSFSTPTFEGFGIDSEFKASDQHEYMVRCRKCSHHNIPAFTPEYICIPGLSSDINDLAEIDSDMANKLDLENSFVRCVNCGHALDLHDPALRTWVPRFPGRRTRGYRITPFSRTTLTIPYIVDQLLKYKRRDAIRRWYNTVLGEAYNDSKARLSIEDIQAVMRQGSKIEVSDQPVFVGIDAGITCHVVLMHMGGKSPVVFDWRQVPADNLVDEVQQILDTYNVIGGSMDRHPYTPVANEIRDMSEGRIMPVEYAGTPTAAAVQLVKDELDNLSHIRGNRTTMIDAVATAVRKRKIEFVGYHGKESIITEHLRDMVRVEADEKDRTKDVAATWKKLNGNDHFFHALAYAVYSLRTTDAILFRQDQEERTSVDILGITFPVQIGAGMDVRSRRKNPISLGQIE